jgi:uridine kinase
LTTGSNFQPLVIGISGISGSGKTFYIEQLQRMLGELVAVISFDDYYRPLEEQASDENGVTNFDLPDSLYHEKFQLDLLKLRENHPVVYKKYHFENYDAPEETAVISPAPIIVAEGLFIFDFPEIDKWIDLRIFVEADMELSLRRRLRRDANERGIPEERSLYQWKHHVLSAWENHILPHRQRCDLVLENNGPADANMLLVKTKIWEKAHPSVRELVK